MADEQDKGTRVERIERRIDSETMREMVIAGTEMRTPVFATMRDILEFAKVMATGGIAVRAHLRENPGACAAICLQAQRWQMDPYAVGNKSYSVNDQLAYESQLIAAVVNTRAPIKGRLRTRFVGEGGNRRCVAWAIFRDDDEPTEVTSPPISQIKPKNSPLWVTDPDQQLSYYTKRLWARRECPEVILGVYDVDEIEAARGPDRARDVTPARPQRRDFVDGSDAGPGPTIVDVVEPVEPTWQFVDFDGEATDHPTAAEWARMFLATQTHGVASFDIRDGIWQTNSPMLAALRATGPAGEKLAAEIHAAHDEVVKLRDEAVRAAGHAEAAPNKERAQATADGGAKPVEDAAVSKMIDYGWRVARNSGREVFDSWLAKQSAAIRAGIEPMLAEMRAAADETSRHAEARDGGTPS